MTKKYIQTLDVNIDDNGNPVMAANLDASSNELGELLVNTGFTGTGKPDILSWASGTDSYAAADSGVITAKRRKVMVFNTGAACLLSIADESGSEEPYVIPNNFIREIILPYEVAIGADITAKNLETGADFGALYVEFS
jgi:hypothetical protein